MGRVFQGQLAGNGLRFALVVSRFNDLITARLREGARDALLRHGVAEEDIDEAWVPGAMEVPLAAQKLAGTGRYQGIVCLGAVIRGSTPHFDYVAGEVSKGVVAVSMLTGVPCGFGVLTTDTIEQAIERAGTKAGNKGYDAAVATLEMATLLQAFEQA